MSAGRRRPPARLGQVVLRLGVIMGALLAIACTRAAAEGPLLVLEVAIAALALPCAVLPDSHVGVLVTALVGANWVATVDDTATPWAIGTAVALALFHTSMAAASVAPLAARWTPAMNRRWSRRLVVVSAAAVPAWLAVAVVDRAVIGGSAALMTASLLTVALFGMWVAAHART